MPLHKDKNTKKFPAEAKRKNQKLSPQDEKARPSHKQPKSSYGTFAPYTQPSSRPYRTKNNPDKGYTSKTRTGHNKVNYNSPHHKRDDAFSPFKKKSPRSTQYAHGDLREGKGQAPTSYRGNSTKKRTPFAAKKLHSRPVSTSFQKGEDSQNRTLAPYTRPSSRPYRTKNNPDKGYTSKTRTGHNKVNYNSPHHKRDDAFSPFKKKSPRSTQYAHGDLREGKGQAPTSYRGNSAKKRTPFAAKKLHSRPVSTSFQKGEDSQNRTLAPYTRPSSRPYRTKNNPDKGYTSKTRTGHNKVNYNSPHHKRDDAFSPFKKKSPRSTQYAHGDLREGKGQAPTSYRGNSTKKRTPFAAKKLHSRSVSTSFQKGEDMQMRLNKYISNSGLGSRRQADEMIRKGLISVNKIVITEMGHKVKLDDTVRYEERVLRAEKHMYVLLNKPKGFITTTSDPEERKTVMGLLTQTGKERLYPVGRLDRNTTGLLLLTNDGELTNQLTHPSYKAKKIYKVVLNRALTKNDFQKITKEGVWLDEGKAIVDDLAIVSTDKKTIGIELHIGWNRVVHRIFGALGYEVLKLDRTIYAGLNKKDLPRGKWRFLKPEEIVLLKHFQNS